MRPFLKLSSFFLVLLISCTSPYKQLQKQEPSASAFRFKPVFDKTLYRCVVDGRFIFKKFHLSGLLFFKTLENGTVRAVYQNEMGYTFFDFEWDQNDSFKVNQIISQLDRPVVVNVLRKDFELLLMKGLDKKTEIFFASNRGNEQFGRLTLERGGYVYYVEKDGRLIRIENAGEKNKVVTISVDDKETNEAMPQHLVFKHHKANFTIELNKIASHVDE